MQQAHVAGVIKGALSRRRLVAARVSRRATGQKDAIARILKGHSPSLSRLGAIADELGLELYFGPPRARLQSENTPPKTASFSDAVAARRGLDPVSDRRLAEILSAISAHFDALEGDYARRSFIDQLYAAGGPALRAQGSRISSRGSDGK